MASRLLFVPVSRSASAAWPAREAVAEEPQLRRGARGEQHDVGPAVAVVVEHRERPAVLVEVEAGGARDVLEAASAVVAQQHVALVLRLAVFLDRLRGKHRGVTALVRYPLRLLTLQQARRLMRILTNAELVKIRRRVPGAPFEIGFWVGSGNTPNRAAQGFGGVPAITLAGFANDAGLLNPPEGDTEAARTARRRSDRYKETLEAYDKLRICPCCGTATGMRRYPFQAGRIGIVCFNDACDWNRENPPSPHRVPLPFLLTDDTIYQRAPAVVLGTIDKLALIGQHDRTINAIVGMLGVARFMDPDNRHFHMPRGSRSLTRAQDEGWTRLKPAYADGAAMFP